MYYISPFPPAITNWHRGYFHYHTSFKFPKRKRITPKKLVQEMTEIGASFVLCGGDHGTTDGRFYFGWDEEFHEYMKMCLENSTSHMILIPSIEIHLRFPPLNERHEHHSCVPTLNYLPELNPAETKAIAISNTKDVRSFVVDCHQHDIPLTLNHPYFSTATAFIAPNPLSIPILRKVDYIELFTGDWPEHFHFDFNIYLKFLQRVSSQNMGCCASVDDALWAHLSPQKQPGIMNYTYLYIPDKITPQAVINSLNKRMAYAVHGFLYFEKISPIPSIEPIRNKKNREINFVVANSAGKRTTMVELYKNGRRIYKDDGTQEVKYEFNWKDNNISEEKASYIIHIRAGDDHLVTSPITYIG